MSSRFTLPRNFVVNGNGVPLAGAKFYFYINGATAPKDTYSVAGLTTSNTNPVVADANGVFGDIWLSEDESYQVTLKTSSDVNICTASDVSPPQTPVAAEDGVYTIPAAGGEPRTIRSKLTDMVSVKDFGAIGDFETDDAPAFQAAIDYVANAGGGGVFVPAVQGVSVELPSAPEVWRMSVRSGYAPKAQRFRADD